MVTPLQAYLAEHREELSPWLEKGVQGRVEIKILPYLQDIEQGFFVEAGALDGLFMSNTKLLEDLGWRGILIEPSQKAYNKCLTNRPNAGAAFGALVSSEYKDEWVYGDFFFDGEDGYGAWSSVNKNWYAIKAVAKTPAVTLGKVLEVFQKDKIDFLSLDVEGQELEALKGIDLAKVNITYILVEVNIKDYALEEMDEYLGKFGYKNLACLSGFTKDMVGWDGSHQDYLYKKNA